MSSICLDLVRVFVAMTSFLFGTAAESVWQAGFQPQRSEIQKGSFPIQTGLKSTTVHYPKGISLSS